MKMCHCGNKSVPGLLASVALCQKHFDGLMYGMDEDYREALRMLRRVEVKVPKRYEIMNHIHRLGEADTMQEVADFIMASNLDSDPYDKLWWVQDHDPRSYCEYTTFSWEGKNLVGTPCTNPPKPKMI